MKKRKLITEGFKRVTENMGHEWYEEELIATFVAYGMDEVEIDLLLNDPDVTQTITDAIDRGFGPEKTALYLLQQADESGLIPNETPSPPRQGIMGENVNEEQLPGGPEFDEIRMQLAKLGMPMKKANNHITGFMMMADNPTYDRILTIDPRAAAKAIVAGNDAGRARRERGEAYSDNKYEFPMEEQGEDHPAQEWREQEADRRWQQEPPDYDPEDYEEPYDDLDECGVFENINETSLGDMYREMGTWFRLDPRLQKIADESRVTDENSEDLQYLVNGWMDGMYDEDPDTLLREIENIIEQL